MRRAAVSGHPQRRGRKERERQGGREDSWPRCPSCVFVRLALFCGRFLEAPPPPLPSSDDTPLYIVVGVYVCACLCVCSVGVCLSVEKTPIEREPTNTHTPHACPPLRRHRRPSCLIFFAYIYIYTFEGGARGRKWHGLYVPLLPHSVPSRPVFSMTRLPCFSFLFAPLPPRR